MIPLAPFLITIFTFQDSVCNCTDPKIPVFPSESGNETTTEYEALTQTRRLAYDLKHEAYELRHRFGDY